MKTKPLLIGALLAAVVNFLLGYLWYMVLFMEQYGNSADKEVNMVLIFVSMLIGTLVLAAIYDKWAGAEYSLMSGLKLGVIAGLIPGLSYALMMMATMPEMTTTILILESAYGIVAFGISGALIGLIYSKVS
jgi:hypothetical protein